MAEPTAHNAHAAPAGNEAERHGALAFLRELPVLVLLAFALAFLIKTFLIQAFYIPSGSMQPTLLPGDRVLVNKIPYYLHEPRRGDVIVFEDPHPSTAPDRSLFDSVLHWVTDGLGFTRPAEEDFIKRVVALPGDTVEGRRGRVLVNGAPLMEPYVAIRTKPFPEKVVPEGKLFVLGDNRGASNDSRFGLGFVPIDKVVGRAFVVIWPVSRAGLIR